MAIGAFKTITQGIQEYLQDQTFSQEIIVRRGNYVTPEVVMDIATNYVAYVFPVNRRAVRESRSEWRRDYIVALVLFRKIEATSSTDDQLGIDDEDEAMALLDEIEASLSTQNRFPNSNTGIGFQTISPTGEEIAAALEGLQRGVFAAGFQMLFVDIA